MKKRFLIPMLVIAFSVTGCNVATTSSSNNIESSSNDVTTSSYLSEETISSENNDSSISSSEEIEDEIKKIYNLYLANGGTSSYEEWLASIKGEKGDKGEPGKDGEPGVGITKVTKINSKDNVDTYRITLSNSKYYDFSITNAPKEENEIGLDFYIQDDDTYLVGIGKACYLSTITIPATYKGKTVSGVKNYFSHSSPSPVNVETIILPNTIKSIGYGAFSDAYKLTNISLPTSVTFIDAYAFGSIATDTITYQGTKEQWDLIEKKLGWESDVRYIVCTDGTIDLYKDVPYVVGDPVKVGLIVLHNDNAIEDYYYMNCFEKAITDLSNKVSFKTSYIKTNVEENKYCYQAAKDLVQQGCNLIFSTSFGHQDFMLMAAKDFPNAQFVSFSGVNAYSNTDVTNYHNYYASIHDGRFLSGYAAGLKYVLTKTYDQLKNDTHKIGYVASYPYAQVISSYTAYYLGFKQALLDTTGFETIKLQMDVEYTYSWYYESLELEAANKLISNGAEVISQYTYSNVVPDRCKECGVMNVSTNMENPSSLAYSSIDISALVEHAVNAMYSGNPLSNDKNNYCGDIWDGSVVYGVNWNLFGDKESLAKSYFNIMVDALNNGTYRVFDTSKFTYSRGWLTHGEDVTIDVDSHITSYKPDIDGDFANDKIDVVMTDADKGITYIAESYFRSAPYFDLIIDGINVPDSD